jgi:hypothetical protein
MAHSAIMKGLRCLYNHLTQDIAAGALDKASKQNHKIRIEKEDQSVCKVLSMLDYFSSLYSSFLGN